MGCPTGLVTAVAAVFISPGALLTPAPKIALFGTISRAGGVNFTSGRHAGPMGPARAAPVAVQRSKRQKARVSAGVMEHDS